MIIDTAIAKEIIDPLAYADGGRVDRAFAELRRTLPLGRAEIDGYDPFWVVTKHADVLEVSRQNDLFHSGDRSTTMTTRDVEAKVRGMMGGSPHLIRSLVQMDAPDHRNYRMLTQAWFLPQNIKKLEARIHEIARGFVQRMLDKGGACDFAADIAFYYPLHVIMEILGVPEADEPLMLRLTQELFGAADKELNKGREELKSEADFIAYIMGVVAEFANYFGAVTADRRASPREDAASLIANATINGQDLGELEKLSYYIIVATAGHDTTSNTTSSGMWALAENPAEFAKLKADPGLIPSFVEELIRWATPVKHFMRSATADTTLRGTPIAKGDWLMLSYPSGNRDEEVFEDPFTFKVDRTPNKHLAFGYGGHICLGQHLARMEMRILWEELLPHLKSVELAGTPRNTDANFVCGPKSVPIRFTLA